MTMTPFGRRSMTLGLIATQAQARDAAPEKTVHKWKVFQSLVVAKDRLGLTDRAMSILSALLTFHQETTLTAGDPLIVFPSNEKLSQRANGVAPTTLRRHLAILVEAGIVIRRDSPNGKRYARRGSGGDIALAFGFELTPLVARAEEFEALAAEIEAEKKAMRLARERITLARRDITKSIELGLDAAIPGDWAALHGQYLAEVARLRRKAGLAEMEASAEALARLAEDIGNHLELFAKSSNADANESRNGAHKQNSNAELCGLEPASEKARGEGVRSEEAGRLPEDHAASEAEKPAAGTPLGMVLDACPAIYDYMTGGEREGPPNWSDFLRAAELVRAMLGISPDAWRDAVETMGRTDAAIAVAAILQKGDDIRFPGGYLRALTEKKRAGHFSVGPILMALIGARLKAEVKR